MKKSYLLRKILLVGLLFVIFSCDKEEFASGVTENSNKESNFSTKDAVDAIFYGPEVAVGKGYVHSWISFDKFQIPLEIGIEMTPEVFNNLPSDTDFEKPLIVPLPIIVQEITPFYHVGINWNPENYSTIEGFKNAHFDFHFYMISEDERMLIPAWSEETDAQFADYPTKNYMPADYSPIPKSKGSFEHIGRYWLSNYFESKLPLKHTMALGTFKGSYIFVCPVAAIDFLKSDKALNEPISQPLYYESPPFFPKEYNIYTNNKGNYCITLTSFITR